MPSDETARLTLDDDTVRCRGHWTVHHLAPVEAPLATLRPAPDTALRFDLRGITAIDTAGAWLLHRTIQRLGEEGRLPNVQGASPQVQGLLGLLAPLGETAAATPTREQRPPLERLGRTLTARANDTLGFIAFVGEAALVGLPLLLRPVRVRWKNVLHNLAQAGYQALPIVGLLSFLIGVVIAYQGGVQLRTYGANVYIADLVGLSILRELAPMMTAIIVAGRTGAAYTAEIGTMRVTEEIDALRAIGIEPMEILVLPKVIALMVALPLLTVFADVMGLLGGMVVAQGLLDVGGATFIDRLGVAITLPSYLIGIGKAPVFAAIVAGVGCYRGLRVEDSAESVGQQTTISVVQAIFLVIVVDAIFSVIFSELGL
jgi:phospholipid/cholesterol/gamma-HCH transport system permease protein